ncbi:HAMP domain-containing sensor histidine kinase [Mesobacillus harenae]|uniref:HAMP domain-containing sensor histidine kinase n=1 Tax=Mesobacillus harenae TaxID=2213203 RepID=UPI0015812012|nr:HAMP domain-containing sensor histidine kinase [Mesobacillus harenae]
MKIKYIYQQFISHISIILVAFLVLSLLFAHYIETLVYENKAEELISYGENILSDLNSGQRHNQTISEYARVLNGRNIQFSIFDRDGRVLIPGGRGGAGFTLTEEEWEQITRGEPVIVKRDMERFGHGVSLVALPYVTENRLAGGIMLTSPISGSREMVSQINQYLIYTILIALAVSFLLSWVLSNIHVKRIKKIQMAASRVSGGDYTVQVPASSLDEIGELSKDFNQMVDKINVSMEEIENLEHRRRQFMADVSHELRTPLTTISGVIEGLRNDMIPEADKVKGINLVSKETKRLIRLVNENLDYEKIRSNQVELSKESIQLVEVLEIIKEQLDFQADDKNNQIIVEADPQAVVLADYDRLVQILINITKNSIQFTTEGTIWLRGRNVNNEAIIEIEDTGMGIDPQEVEKIWHRFYRADISRKSNPYGEFGLGLSIVKKLVQLHDGKIEVVSERNKGTKFIIKIPV